MPDVPETDWNKLREEIAQARMYTTENLPVPAHQRCEAALEIMDDVERRGGYGK